jgi:hypothetical protein
MQATDGTTDILQFVDQSENVLGGVSVSGVPFGALATGPTGPTGATGATGATGPTGAAIASASAPASATAAGATGTVAYDATHIYVCLASGSWVRGSLAGGF